MILLLRMADVRIVCVGVSYPIADRCGTHWPDLRSGRTGYIPKDLLSDSDSNNDPLRFKPYTPPTRDIVV